MKPLPKNIFLAAVLSLVLTYFFPIWHIDLEAPQYPEGIGMYIWLDQITGENPNDLNNINNLNHYIGMKKIIPESIPELKLMPYIIGFLIVSGLLAYLSNRKLFVWIWLGVFLVILAAGLYDFYIWEYDYGHDLNPTAAIKVPGMNYQPPLIGSKQLLNFVSTSLPAFGGVVIGLSIVLTSLSLFIENKKGDKHV